MTKDTGGWKDYRELHTPSDIAFLSAAWAAGKRFAQVRELTVLKFPGPWRKDIYKAKPSFEQQSYLARLNDPALAIDELTLLALAQAEGNSRSPVEFSPSPKDAPAGWSVDQWRERKGLPRAGGERASLPIYRDPEGLRSYNRRQDIVPQDGLAALYSSNNLPTGIFLGRGWHELERDGEQRFRWMETDGEIIVTSPSAERRSLVLDVESGPSRNCDPFELTLTSEEGEPVATATVSYRHPISLEIPPNAAEAAVFRLVAPAGGASIPGDTRILNLRVFQIRWGTSTTAEPT
jgi:hypothetical protein